MNMNDDADRRRRAEEEERLTPYSAEDLADSWQFKIVQGHFRDPAWVHAVIQEQAHYGWIFLEKFDDSRIRFKRRASEAARDVMRGGNPYSTRSAVATGGCQFLLAAGLLITALAVAGTRLM